jgi:hypothetical protein
VTNLTPSEGGRPDPIRILERDFSAFCGEVENPKFEARNPKQVPMIKIQMTKPDELAPDFCFEHWSISSWNLFRISDFDI